MRLWKALLLTSCALLSLPLPSHAAREHAPRSAASTASEAVFSALDNVALGSATLAASPDHAGAVISNIGSSGNDGVQVLLSGLSGAAFRMRKRPEVLASADVGAECRYKLFSLTGAPGAVGESLMELTFHVSDTQSSLSCGCPPRFGSVVYATVWRAGQLVLTSTLPPGTPVLLERSAGTPSFVPDLAGSYRVRPHGWDGTIKGRICADASLGGDRSVTLGGTTVVGDEVTFEMEETTSLGTNPLYELRASLCSISPPGSSYSSLTLDSEECLMGDQWVSGLGASHLVCSNGACALQGLDASGSGGLMLLPHHGRLLDAEDCPIAIGDPGVNGVAMGFAPSGLVFDPVADEGASLITTLHGSGGCAGDNVLASLRCTMHAGQLELGPDFSGVCAVTDSFVVSSQRMKTGTVKFFNEAKGFGMVVVRPTVGTPPAMMLSAAGRSSSGWDLKTGTRVVPQQAPALRIGAAAAPTVSASLTDGLLILRCGFSCARVFVFGGEEIVGDEITFCCAAPGLAPGAVPGIVVSSQSVRLASGAPPAATTQIAFAGMQAAGGDQVVADPSPSLAITPGTCGSQVPVIVSRSVSTTPVRAFSVTVHLSSNLALSSPVVEGDYLSRGNPTQMFVTSNGGGSYTVDCAVLSPSCTATGSGTLFELPLCAAAPASNGIGTVSIDGVTFRDCSNVPIPMSAGSAATIPIQVTAPPAVSGLTALQVKSGNGAGGTTGIALSWAPLASTLGVEVYRAPFGGYPLYDKSPLALGVPPAPTTCPPPSPWSLASLSASSSSGALDHPPSRDFYYFVVLARDAYGNASSCSNRTGGTLDYFLGDESDGHAECSGDNHVDLLDISLLGAHYGSRVLPGSSYACVDVGPTTDFSVDARPLVDGRLSFEDLIVHSMNFSVTSSPRAAARTAPAAADAVRLAPVTLPAVGETFELPLLCDAAGDVQALSVALAYDHAVLEQVGITNGELLGRQDRPGMALSSGPGDVDAALLGAGAGLSGSGELARVSFRVRAAGDPQLSIAGVDARDGANRPVAMALGGANVAPPARTTLGTAFPNPFSEQTTVRLSLHAAGAASLRVYDIAGRRVRTLLRGEQPAGTLGIGWDGRDDAGIRQAAGVYLVRLEAGDVRETRLVRLVP